MKIAASCLGTGVLVLAFFSLGRPQMSMQDAGRTELARSQSKGVPSLNRIYSPDPDHIWNRIFRLFYLRHARNGHQYGGDELDPYLWWQTKYLLSGSSHDEALKLLDEFLQQHAERLILDSLRRALFQRDLLAVYEWLSTPSDEQGSGRSALEQRIAEIITRLALTSDEIGKLPDNYTDAIRSHVFPH